MIFATKDEFQIFIHIDQAICSLVPVFLFFFLFYLAYYFCDFMFFLFVGESYSILQIQHDILTHSMVDRNSVCFLFGATVNKAATYISIKVTA